MKINKRKLKEIFLWTITGILFLAVILFVCYLYLILNIAQAKHKKAHPAKPQPTEVEIYIAGITENSDKVTKKVMGKCYTEVRQNYGFMGREWKTIYHIASEIHTEIKAEDGKTTFKSIQPYTFITDNFWYGGSKRFNIPKCF